MKYLLRSLVPFLGEKDNIRITKGRCYPYMKEPAVGRVISLAIAAGSAIAAYALKEPILYAGTGVGGLFYLSETVPYMKDIIRNGKH